MAQRLALRRIDVRWDYLGDAAMVGLSEERQKILEALIRLQRELGVVREDFSKAGKQLGFAVENFEKADKRLAKFEGRLGAIESAQPAQLELKEDS